MIPNDRVRLLNDLGIDVTGSFVLYWMQADHRTEENHALEYAVDQANKLNVPVEVRFFLDPHYPDAHMRHYVFMLQGLRDVARALKERGILFAVEVVRPGNDVPGAVARTTDRAALVVTDVGYLRVQRDWRRRAAPQVSCRMVQVETGVVVPVETASPKEEYAAATIRPKIRRTIGSYLSPVEKKPVQTPVQTPVRSSDRDSQVPSALANIADASDSDLLAALKELGVSGAVAPVSWISGGQTEAVTRLSEFLANNLSVYDTLRNDPVIDRQSNLSPYLHFGQIASHRIVRAVLRQEEFQGRIPRSAADPADFFRVEALSSGAQSFIEELVVRRELSMNFCHYNTGYDTFTSLPSWAQTTLMEHRNDPRPVTYTRRQLEQGETHDPYWNAAQTEMVTTGKMHGYMRMYWGKKIIEWSTDPESAFETMINLNNRYFLDGRDPNGYTGVAWCLGKHDRPWKEREIFGKVRYMNDRGLERKFKIRNYVDRIINPPLL